MKKKAIIFYLVCLHVLLILMLVKSNFIHIAEKNLGDYQSEEITNHYRTMVAFHYRVDRNLQPGAVLFIGDSHIQGLAVSAIDPRAVNYGIGNDTSIGVIERLPYYNSLRSAAAVILAFGYNDLRRRDNGHIIDNFKRILAIIPYHVNVILCAIPAVTVAEPRHNEYNQRITKLNIQLEKLRDQYGNVSYLNPFAFIQQQDADVYRLIDGIHLNKLGYDIWINELKVALRMKP